MSDQLLIRIDPELKRSLEKLSRAEGKTSSGVVRELIGDYIRRRDISGYIDGLWDRIGKKLGARGAKKADVDRAIAEARRSGR